MGVKVKKHRQTKFDPDSICRDYSQNYTDKEQQLKLKQKTMSGNL